MNAVVMCAGRRVRTSGEEEGRVVRERVEERERGSERQVHPEKREIE